MCISKKYVDVCFGQKNISAKFFLFYLLKFGAKLMHFILKFNFYYNIVE